MLVHLRDLCNSIEKERGKPKFAEVFDELSKSILLIIIGEAELAEDQTPLPQTEIGNVCKKLEQYVKEYIKAKNKEEKEKFGEIIIKTFAVLTDCIIFEGEPDYKEICNRIEKIELGETV
jgi:hypothetical protein